MKTFYMVVKVDFDPETPCTTQDPAQWIHDSGLDRMFKDETYGAVKNYKALWVYDEEKGFRPYEQ